MSRLLTPLMTAGLLVPYAMMLAVHWLGDSKHSAASGLAFAGALVLGWREHSRIRQGTPDHPVLGAMVLSLATLAYVASVILDFRVGVGACAPVILILLLYVSRGWQAISVLRLPIVLLLLATPIPGFVMDGITYFLLDILQAVLPPILAVMQIDVIVGASTLSGNGWSVQIVEDCSGLGGILLFVPLTFLLLYSNPRVPPMGYGLVLLASLPIAFGGTVLRILVDCVLGEMNSSLFTSDFFHQVVGLVALLLGIVILVLLCRLFTPREQPAIPQEALA